MAETLHFFTSQQNREQRQDRKWAQAINMEANHTANHHHLQLDPSLERFEGWWVLTDEVAGVALVQRGGSVVLSSLWRKVAQSWTICFAQ